MRQSRIVAMVVVALLMSGAGQAAADPVADRCGGTKAKAVAKYAKTIFVCQAKALRRGEPVDPNCRTKAAGRLTQSFDKAESSGGCATLDDETDFHTDMDAALAAVEALLSPGSNQDALKCASGKLRTSGRHIGARINCYGRTAVRGFGPDDRCLERSNKKLVAGFSSAERRGGCTTTADSGVVSDFDHDTAQSLVRLVSPVCGDALLGPLQECEDPEDTACPGLCSQSCVCVVPPECGDGVAELPEECDDMNLQDGDGCSSLCQLEDATALCTGVAAAVGTQINATLISDEFTAPLFLTAPPLDARRLFVVERRGLIRILNLVDNSVAPAPFLNIDALTTTGGERGLLSMAFDPGYEDNGRFFISHTNTSGDLVLARYEVDGDNSDLADESTRQEILVVPHPGASNHNGGQVQFSPDGYLYWGMGDGGKGLEAQDDNFMLGKILRLDVTHDSAPFATVPPTNPHYVDGTSDLEYVWAGGLRNPWRFSFDRLTGDLYIGDVGAGHREEVNFAPASSIGGENYGWNTFEGTRCARSSCPEPPIGFTMPVHEYPHTEGCAVMGGYAYRGCAMPGLAGSYFFTDLCSTLVQTFEMAGGVATNLTDRTDDARSTGAVFTGVVSWGQDARGELYIINGNNRIYRIDPE